MAIAVPGSLDHAESTTSAEATGYAVFTPPLASFDVALLSTSWSAATSIRFTWYNRFSLNINLFSIASVGATDADLLHGCVLGTKRRPGRYSARSYEIRRTHPETFL